MFYIGHPLEIPAILPPGSYHLWEVDDQFCSQRIMKNKGQQQCQRQIKIENTGDGMAVLAVHAHSNEILKIGDYASDDKPGQRNPLFSEFVER